MPEPAQNLAFLSACEFSRAARGIASRPSLLQFPRAGSSPVNAPGHAVQELGQNAGHFNETLVGGVAMTAARSRDPHRQAKASPGQ